MRFFFNIFFPVLALLPSLFSPIAADDHPFNYDLQTQLLPGRSESGKVMLCLHGYGGSHRIGNRLRGYPVIQEHIVSFNFPDHDLEENVDQNTTVFGTIHELLPPLYLIKTYVIDKQHDSINLYGFSAGGGALINLISVLNTNKYNAFLKTIGITLQNKKIILNAIQKGNIILDCPLKSLEEITGFRDSLKELEIVGQRYKKNDLRPIDSIQKLKGLSLNILVYFQNPDEILSNQDDILYLNALKSVNSKGNTCIVISNDGGHNAYHASLWEVYADFMKGKHHNLFIDKTMSSK